MPDRLHLEIVTPERKVFEAEVDSVEIPGLDGELGILPGHTELISQLKPAGLLTFHRGEERGEIAVGDGFVEISDDRVVVLANTATKPEDIDLTRALDLRNQAERQLQKALSDPDMDVERATIDLERASIEVRLVEKSR